MARIFLCHASEDKAQVREVYHRLRVIDGFEPWLDEENLLPGQDWDYEIKKALKASDFILIFLSRSSVAKRGYVQREMKMALDAWQELPEGTIHTVPVRLDDCDVPEDFRRYHWANLFEPNGFDHIVRAIRAEVAKRSGPTPPPGSQPPPRLVDAVPQKRRLLWVGGVLLGVLVTALYLALSGRTPGPQPQDATITTPRPPTQESISVRNSESTQPASLLTNSLGMQFALVPAGEFQMGSANGSDNERPVHTVRISKPFYRSLENELEIQGWLP
jgi:hypothetical protein